MAVTLRYLMKYAKENYGMNLICGEQSMNNPVNWVHMLEDPETAGFLKGQELIFTTGIGHEDTSWFTDFAKGLVANQASGLVLNIGPYIPSVPVDLIEYCRAEHFPLFTIPWKTRIVDITNDFCRKIIKSEENEDTVAGAFRNAIFHPERITEIRPLLERKEFDPQASFCVAAISLQTPSPEKINEFDKQVRLILSRLLYANSERFNLFRQDRYLILIAQDFTEDILEMAIQATQERIASGSGTYSIRAGLAINDTGLQSLPQNYKRALSLLKMSEKQGKLLVSYRHIGLYRLLLEVADQSVTREFFEDTLSPLEKYDQQYGTDYLSTLKSWLENNGSVQELAKNTFVHRNTINYKMKKIREITNSELDWNDSLRFLLAFYLKELL